MSILKFTNVNLQFGQHKLLDNASFSVEPGERVCIVGRNGSGKSTILKVLEGLQDVDSGSIVYEGNTKVARLQQDPPEKVDQTAYDYIGSAFTQVKGLLAEYDQALEQFTEQNSPELNQKISDLQAQIDQLNG